MEIPHEFFLAFLQQELKFLMEISQEIFFSRNIPRVLSENPSAVSTLNFSEISSGNPSVHFDNPPLVPFEFPHGFIREFNLGFQGMNFFRDFPRSFLRKLLQGSF